MVNYIPPFNFHFLIFISILLKITETRRDSKPVCYFWINILFVVCVPHVHVSEHFKVCAPLLPSYGWIFRKPVDISRCTSCFKYIDLKAGRQPECEKRRLGWYQNVGIRKLRGTQNVRILKLWGTQNARILKLRGTQNVRIINLGGIQNARILKLRDTQNVRILKLGGTQNARILKLGGTQNAEMKKLEGYQRETLNTGIPKWLLAVGSCLFSVQDSSRVWCGEQSSLFHSSSNVTPFSCSSASVSSRYFKKSSKISHSST